MMWSDLLGGPCLNLLDWAQEQPWARAMARCPQDPEWHAEGDVWTHTCMVWEEIQRLPEFPELPPADQLKLLFTGLLHDAGKASATSLDEDTGRLHSPRHSLASAALARGRLRDLGCPLDVREEIVHLVRYHGRPPYLLEKADPAREVIGLSWLLCNRLLHLFAVADTRGRVTSANCTRAVEVVDLWRLVAEENGCFLGPYPFLSEEQRFLFFRGKLSSLCYQPPGRHRCRVTMVSGLPGAGKDTWLAAHRPRLPAVSLDAVRKEIGVAPREPQGRVAQIARERCREHLRAGRDFAFNATNLTRLVRSRWLELFAGYKAYVEIVYIEPPLEQIYRQNRQRPQPVPERVITALVDKTEPATAAECHSLRLATS